MWTSIIKWASIGIVTAIISYVGLTIKNNIEEAAIAKQLHAEQARVIADLNTQLKNNAKITDDHIKIIEELNSKNLQLTESLDKIQEYINSEQGSKDSEHVCIDAKGNRIVTKESSQVLKRTVRELSRQAR